MTEENGVVHEEHEYREQDDPFGELKLNLNDRSAPHEIVREFISEEGIEGKTNLSKAQIQAFTILEIYDKEYPELNISQLKRYLLYKISQGGESRKGLMEMLKGNVGMRQLPGEEELRRR